MGRAAKFATIAMAAATFLVAGSAQADLGLERDAITDCENVIHVGERLISGGEPHSEAALKALAEKGVTTIVSVDGARPDIETAAKYGIRYIHLPIGYDGIDRARAIELGKALEAAPEGKTYVHCHHGKHRGPAAIAMGLRVLGLWEPAEAETFLKEAGTSSKYDGLYRDVREATEATANERARVTELPEVADVGEMVANMALVDRAADSLAACKEAGWAVPAEHPDIVPWREASKIVDLLRAADVPDQDYDDAEGLRHAMKESATLAEVLQKALEANDTPTAETAYTALRQSCNTCHDVWRN